MEVKKEAVTKKKAEKEWDEKTKEGEATKRDEAESRGNTDEDWSRNHMERQTEKKMFGKLASSGFCNGLPGIAIVDETSWPACNDTQRLLPRLEPIFIDG